MSKGRVALLLDYSPKVINLVTGKKRRFEYLKLYLFVQPKTNLEKQHNRETEHLAENIRAHRQLDMQAALHGFAPDYKRLQSFNAYFRRLANRQRGMNRHNWDSAVRYFEKFADGDIRFIDIDLSLCEDFKAYLRSGPKLREARAGIGHNSALSYFNKFRNALKQAWREKLVLDDFYALSRGLKEREALVEFLTMSDIRLLLQTPASSELCKRVVLFGILTGLRFCDIHALIWQEVRGTADQYYLQFSQRKTLKTQHMPISNQAYELLGERELPGSRVFKKLYYNQIRDFLVQWPAQAGITKHLTFCCLRHTYATLQLNNGTDIYTVSKMLGHRHVKTTQRYTRLLDQKKRETTNRIIIDGI
ncbi:site-specific integrase [Mucilaginibacter boryungensis]|uniref:Site-specific integrase n=2 Tax=Mucilaginibacter boryungensis TaxID=768480 RepID=A0ABR9XEL7_9SPHI|nr:site-specific integrase [Mucilaginibacter boryungensis]MBE9665434.1 site-specific integrase [Mucilaginibacter boryungensis]